MRASPSSWKGRKQSSFRSINKGLDSFWSAAVCSSRDCQALSLSPKFPREKNLMGSFGSVLKRIVPYPLPLHWLWTRAHTDTLKNHLLMHLKMPSLNVILLHPEVRCCGWSRGVQLQITHLIFIRYFLSIYCAQAVGGKKMFTTGSLAWRSSLGEMIK